jgi:alpha-glucosidase
MMLNLGLSGIPFIGPDVGGFSGSPGAELFTRWFQFATFLPFFRTHSAFFTPRREPWTFGEPYLSIMREFLELRYKLLPYIYTLAWQSSQYGHPMVRPLFWHDPEDQRLWDVDDVILLGENLLVAPILEEKAESRILVLPKGRWFNFWDDTQLQGPDEVEIDVSLERIPLFVSAGCVLPMEKESVLELHLYPSFGKSGRGILYSDEGDGYGTSRLDRFEVRRDGHEILLDWDKGDGYALPYSMIEVQLHGEVVVSAEVDGGEVPCERSRIAIKDFNQLRLRVQD